MDQEKQLPGTVETIVTDFEINREANDTELLISRLRHPVIKRQVIDILFHIKSKRHQIITDDEWEILEDLKEFNLMRGKNTGMLIEAEELAKCLERPMVTKDEVEAEYDELVDDIATTTNFDYATDMPSAGVMHLGWVDPVTGKSPSTKQWSHIEAHEKGHVVRGEYHELDELFQAGFDISKATFTEDDYQMFRREEGGDSASSDGSSLGQREELRSHFFENLFSAHELAERMSQLKNYFGFSGAEIFTKGHLDYARAHYIKDVGLENGMRQFFEAITPETEEKFLYIINNYGI